MKRRRGRARKAARGTFIANSKIMASELAGWMRDEFEEAQLPLWLILLFMLSSFAMILYAFLAPTH